MQGALFKGRSLLGEATAAVGGKAPHHPVGRKCALIYRQAGSKVLLYYFAESNKGGQSLGGAQGALSAGGPWLGEATPAAGAKPHTTPVGRKCALIYRQAVVKVLMLLSQKVTKEDKV